MRLVLNEARNAPLHDSSLLPSAKLGASMRTLRERYRNLVAPRLVSGPSGSIVIDETAQVTGSFKVRGALAKLEALKSTGVTHVVAASAGNHGAGVAFAAALLGMRATVVVPSTAPMVKREKIAAAAGVTLQLSAAPDYDGAEQEARSLAERTGVPFVSPYDDAIIVAGNGMSLGFDLESLLRERFRGALPSPLHVLAPVGGGGLAVGLACALPSADVYGVQSEASPALALSFETGGAVEQLPPASATWAEGLEGGIAASAYLRARSVLAGVFVATEDEIRDALVYAHRTLHVPAEGSAAVALCPVLHPIVREHPARFPGTVVSVLTGRNIDSIKVESL